MAIDRSKRTACGSPMTSRLVTFARACRIEEVATSSPTQVSGSTCCATRVEYIARKVGDALDPFHPGLSASELALVARYLRGQLETEPALLKLVNQAMDRAA